MLHVQHRLASLLPSRRRARTPLAAALLGLCAPACDSPAAPAGEAHGGEEQRPPLVRVSPLQLRQVRREIETTAYLESEHRVVVLSKVAGRVLEVLADEGRRVRYGEVLAHLDDREAQAAKRQVEVLLEDRKVRSRLAALEMEAAARREAQARIDRERAKAEHDRLSAQDQQIVARKSMEDAKWALDSAEEALSLKGFERRKAALDHEAALGIVRELEARLIETALRLEEHEIKAPLDGVVSARRVKGGETIGNQTELFEVVDLEHLVSYISRPQIELSLVRDTKEVAFRADAFPDREFTADVDLVLPTVDRDTGHFRLRVRVRPPDAQWLRPGMFLRARILTEGLREALMVPKAAVLADGDASIVFAVRDGRASRVVLEPGLEEQLWIECRNRGEVGLAPADVVITAGHEELKDQTAVEVGGA